MDKNIQISIAKRLLAHLEAGTTDSADDLMNVPVSDYFDEDKWNEEIELFYKRKPVVVGLSAELPEVGSFLSLTIVDVPILITRTTEGLQAFFNVCRHRGAMVAPEQCSGKQNRFTCPYHGWTYDNSGKLIAVANAKTFGSFDMSTHGLTRLAVAERSGVIVAVLTPGIEFDIEEWMSGVDKHMGLENRLDDYTLIGTREVQAANWKLVVEGHLESYHFASLHRDSIAPFMVSNCTTFDRFGPHILITFVQHHIEKLRDLPEEEWEPLKDDMINVQYVMFPGVMVVVWQNSIGLQIIQPSKEPGRSVSRIVYAVRSECLATDEDVAKAEATLNFNANLVEQEDYIASFQIQRGFETAAQTEIMFGKNELGLQLFRQSLESQY